MKMHATCNRGRVNAERVIGIAFEGSSVKIRRFWAGNGRSSRLWGERHRTGNKPLQSAVQPASSQVEAVSRDATSGSSSGRFQESSAFGKPVNVGCRTACLAKDRYNRIIPATPGCQGVFLRQQVPHTQGILGMASPFSIFRKHQKWLMAGVTLFAMFAFVAINPFSGSGGGSRSGGQRNDSCHLAVRQNHAQRCPGACNRGGG